MIDTGVLPVDVPVIVSGTDFWRPYPEVELRSNPSPESQRLALVARKAAEMQCYFYNDGKVCGTQSLLTIFQQIHRNQLPGDVQVCEAGTEKWVSAQEILSSGRNGPEASNKGQIIAFTAPAYALPACGRCGWRQDAGRELSACEQRLQIAATVRESKDADRIAKQSEINAVRKTRQPHTAHIRKADGELERVLGCTAHGSASFVNQPDCHSGVAQMIPERSLLDVAVNQRVLSNT